jgi:hypothetical protein
MSLNHSKSTIRVFHSRALSYFGPCLEGHSKWVHCFEKAGDQFIPAIPSSENYAMHTWVNIPNTRRRRLTQVCSERSSPLDATNNWLASVATLDISPMERPTPEAVPASGVWILNGRNVTFSSTSHILFSNIHRSTQHSVRNLWCSSSGASCFIIWVALHATVSEDITRARECIPSKSHYVEVDPCAHINDKCGSSSFQLLT